MAVNDERKIADINLLVRTAIEKAIANNGWSSAEYAKKVGIPTLKVISLRKGLIMIDDLTVGELRKICAFHNLDFI